ncbi:unnamed protein product [Arctogadus glacialis]
MSCGFGTLLQQPTAQLLSGSGPGVICRGEVPPLLMSGALPAMGVQLGALGGDYTFGSSFRSGRSSWKRTRCLPFFLLGQKPAGWP